MRSIPHYINGAHVEGTSGRTADVFNPATGEVQAQVPLANASELNTAIENRKKSTSCMGAAIRKNVLV